MHAGRILLIWVATAVILVVGMVASGMVKVDVDIDIEVERPKKDKHKKRDDEAEEE